MVRDSLRPLLQREAIERDCPHEYVVMRFDTFFSFNLFSRNKVSYFAPLVIRDIDFYSLILGIWCFSLLYSFDFELF
jgi:hypothetical protein